MAYTYLFFKPARLPLTPEELSDATVRLLDDASAAQAMLARALPAIEWGADNIGRAQVDAGWVEFRLPTPGSTLSMRCSLRADYSADVQRLCDESGWLAFDEQPMWFQPGQAPMLA
jgi:hypothetical protein